MIKEILKREIDKWKKVNSDITKRENTFKKLKHEELEVVDPWIRKEANEVYKSMQDTINKELRKFKKEMKALRIRWISWRMNNLDQEIKNAYLNYSEMRKEKIPHWLCLSVLEGLRGVKNLEAQYSKLKHEKRMLEDATIIEREKLDIQAIKDNLDINLVVTLNAGGFCSCPFHKDKTPSMRWYPESKTLHCFSCGWHGDVISFIMKRDNLPFLDVIRKIK